MTGLPTARADNVGPAEGAHRAAELATAFSERLAEHLEAFDADADWLCKTAEKLKRHLVTQAELRTGSAPDPEPVEPAADACTVHVYHVSDDMPSGRRPRLLVFDNHQSEMQLQDRWITQYQNAEYLGELTVARHALAIEIEREAMKKFGGHVTSEGRPVGAEYCEQCVWDELIGQVATVYVTWPRYSLDPGGDPTAGALAEILGRNVEDVREALDKLGVGPRGRHRG